MARIIQNKWPIDLQKSRAIGFGFPLNGDAVFVPTYFTRDQIKANLVNYLLTNKGERVFKPNFGANLRSFIAEGINDGTTSALEQRITDGITTNFPSIEVLSMNFDNQTDRNTMNFTLNYEVRNIGVEDEIKIALI